jgi:protease I
MFRVVLFFSFAFVLMSAAVSFAAGLQGKKIVMIIAAKNFRDEELLTPLSVFRSEGAQVRIASSVLDLAYGMLGSKVVPDTLYDNLKVNNYDAVIFVGGSGATQYWNDPYAHQIAREALAAGKVLGAICIAPVTLANAGVLKGRKATVWSSDAEKLRQRGAEYTGKDVTVDGLIVTGNGPEAAKRFSEAIVTLLRKE